MLRPLVVRPAERYNPTVGRSSSALVALVTAALLAPAGCTPRRPAPVDTLRGYSAALSAGDYDAAYALMSEEYRRNHTKEEFQRQLDDSPREVKETARRLQGAYDDIEISAEFRYGLGDRMRLVREEGEWRIASNPIAYYSQGSPRAALRSFLRAYQLKRWDIMLRLVPNEYRERMTAENVRDQFEGARAEEIAVMMNTIEANVDEPIEEKGATARMKYGGNYEVQFVREDGLWKIKEPE